MKNAAVAVMTVALWLAVAPSPALAQLAAAREGPIVYGHHHLYVTSVAESKKFWVDTLGGVPVKVGALEMLRFPNVFVILNEKKPTGGTKGSIVNHIGFNVPNLRAMLDKAKGAGYPIVTRQELAAADKDKEKDGIAFIPNQNTSVAFVMGPDETKIEFHENKTAAPLSISHVHYFTPQVEEMRAWYVKVFGAEAGRLGDFQTANLPGVRLVFAKSPEPTVAPTADRVLDHVGFEVRDLEAFAKKLEGMGIKLDRPYGKIAVVNNLGVVFLTNPWGTKIELTEGLDKIQ